MSRGRLAGRPYPLTHHTTLGWSPGQRDGVLAGGGWLWWFAGGQPRSSRSLPRHAPWECTLPSTIKSSSLWAFDALRQAVYGQRRALKSGMTTAAAITTDRRALYVG